MNYESAKTYLKKHGQEHLLAYYNELSPAEQKSLLSDIEACDFTVIENINNNEVTRRGALAPINNAVSVEDAKRRRLQFEKVGLNLLSDGKVGAVLLAGGMGSRLGFNGPKGTFDIGLTREISIFELQMRNIEQVAKAAGRYFPLFIMTARANNAATVRFFKQHNYFGYPRDCVYFFTQEEAPACDFNGKVFLAEKHRVALAPNGNGGWYSSLLKSGLGSVLQSQNIEWLNVYSVDNVLQKICDPVFIGATVLKHCACGAKVVKKVSAEEKVGLLCLEDGKPAIVEYYEMPENLKTETEGGELKYRYGVTLNYLFGVRDLNKALKDDLPYHVAKKAIPHIENGKKAEAKTPCGCKFEKLVLDLVKLMDSCLAFEVEREKEFAPVKNASGADSVETARALLKLNGVSL